MIARSLALVPFVTAFAAAALPRPPVIDPAAAARAFREAQIVSRADGGALWGHPLWERMVFIDAGAGRIAASEAVPGLELEETGGVWLGALPDDLGAANTAQDWRGEVWTSVLWPLPGGEASRLRLLGHEMYHRVQRELPPCPLPPRPCDHLDTEVGRLWLRLEWRALADALRTTGESRRTAVADALLFRAARYELLPGARDAEVALESNEGVAEATGYFVLRLSSEKRAAALAARLAEDERQ